jgi:5-methylcytosine-specific restriction endonuclease McrA
VALSLIADAWHFSRSRNGALLVLLAIADTCPEIGVPSTVLTVAELQQRTGLSRRAVQASVRELEHLGELRVEAQPGRYEANRQTITLAREPRPRPDRCREEAIQARRRKARSKSRTIWDRDGWECQVRGQGCTGHRYLTVGHVIAIEAGGTEDDENLQTECEHCNKAKQEGGQ